MIFCFYKPDCNRNINRYKRSFDFSLRLYILSDNIIIQLDQMDVFYDLKNNTPVYNFLLNTEPSPILEISLPSELINIMNVEGFKPIRFTHYLRFRDIALNIIRTSVSKRNFSAEGYQQFNWSNMSNGFMNLKLEAVNYSSGYIKTYGMPYKLLERFHIFIAEKTNNKKRDFIKIYIHSKEEFYIDEVSAFSFTPDDNNSFNVDLDQHNRLREICLSLLFINCGINFISEYYSDFIEQEEERSHRYIVDKS